MTNKKPYHHGDLRQSLLDAAACIIQESSAESLSMRKLADRVGVSRTALYHHFDDKHQLLCALAEDGFRRQIASFKNSHGAEAVDGLDQAEFALRFRAFIRNYVEFASAQPQHYDLMFGREIWRSEPIPAQLKDCAHDAFQQFAQRIGAWQAAGLIPESVDTLRFAQVIWSTVHGLSRSIIDGIYVDVEAMGAICDAAADTFLRSLGVNTRT